MHTRIASASVSLYIRYSAGTLVDAVHESEEAKGFPGAHARAKSIL